MLTTADIFNSLATDTGIEAKLTPEQKNVIKKYKLEGKKPFELYDSAQDVRDSLDNTDSDRPIIESLINQYTAVANYVKIFDDLASAKDDLAKELQSAREESTDRSLELGIVKNKNFELQADKNTLEEELKIYKSTQNAPPSAPLLRAGQPVRYSTPAPGSAPRPGPGMTQWKPSAAAGAAPSGLASAHPLQKKVVRAPAPSEQETPESRDFGASGTYNKETDYVRTDTGFEYTVGLGSVIFDEKGDEVEVDDVGGEKKYNQLVDIYNRTKGSAYAPRPAMPAPVPRPAPRAPHDDNDLLKDEEE